jgi:phosphotriesterase-related protein
MAQASMSSIGDTEVMVNTVTGRIGPHSLGRTLTHEHLINDVRRAVVPGARPGTADLLNSEVSAENRQRLLAEPYSCYDNCTLDDQADALSELASFASLGGGTVVDVTPPSLGRDPLGLKALSEVSKVSIVMGSGWYLEHFESSLGSVDELVASLAAEFREGIDGVFPGVIGEIGVSADFTSAERRALRAACLVQQEVGVPLFIHLPGWKRRGPEVLGIVLDEMNVDPAAVVLCHMDPSGHDDAYQRSIVERGVWVEFDMIGMPSDYPGEGRSPSTDETVAAIARLIEQGAADRLLFSHDLFLKSMLSRFGGNGLGFVPGAFRDRLIARGIDADSILDTNPRQLFVQAARPKKVKKT